MRITLGLMLVALSACGGSDGPGTASPPGSAGSGQVTGSAGAMNGPGSAGSSESGGTPGAAGAAGSTDASGRATIVLPEVYPPVRAATPSALIADPAYASLRLGPAASAASRFGTARQALNDAINLASAVQDRFYSTGPTDLLRIVKEVDDRVAGLGVNGPGHTCLDAAPIGVDYALPGAQTFHAELQCMQQFGTPGGGGGWIAFGLAPATPETAAADAGAHTAPLQPDAGVADAGGGDAGQPAPSGALDADPTTDAGPLGGEDVYLVEGQPGGNGGVYRIRPNGDVEGWLAVAEKDIPANSQVIMHLRTHKASGTLELALAGAGVGFCSAHLKTNPDFLFVSGKTNAPPPGGTTQQVGTQYCDAPRSGCFQATALATDLGAGSPSCAAIASSTFDIGVELDASSDPGANVVTGNIYTYFSSAPTGVPAF
jgi:hypothetical protein